MLRNLPFIYLLYKKVQYIRLRRYNGLSNNGLLQSAPTTQLNRHPDIFKALNDRFGDRKIRVLSFGCSTGEECQSLSEYLPLAEIVGVDVNRKSIEKAQLNYSSESISFFHMETSGLKKLGEFDLILAVSVLCRYPESNLVEDSSSLFPFDLYNDSVDKLSAVLKPNGFLFIRSSNYRFMDTAISKDYQVVNFKGQRQPERFPKFDSHNKKIKHHVEMEELFQKD